MNNHSKKALKIFCGILIVILVIVVTYSFSKANNTAEEYRADLAHKIAQVYPDFEAQRENFYDLTGIDTTIETEEEKRNKLFNDFYSALTIKEKAKVDERIDYAVDNIYSSIDLINSKIAELIDMFESATTEEVASFQDDFQIKSQELTKNLETFYKDLLAQE